MIDFQYLKRGCSHFSYHVRNVRLWPKADNKAEKKYATAKHFTIDYTHMDTKKHTQIKSNDLLNLIDSRHINAGKNEAVISTVFSKSGDGSWKFLIGKCEFQENIDELEEIYSNIAFIRRVIKEFDIKIFLSDLESDGYQISETLPVLKVDRGQTRWNEEIIPSNFTRSNFPERKYSARITHGSEFRESALLGYGMPYHSSSSDYLKNFMGLFIYHGQSHGDNGELSIFMGDERGKIVFDGEYLSVEGNESDICLVGKLESGDSIKIDHEKTFKISEPELLKSELWLINKNNEILDFRSVSHDRYNLSLFEKDKDRAEPIISLIENGESHFLEFKVYIDLKNKKVTEIEKTVCAFSNAQGGKLIIGVDDEGNIIGIDEKVREAYKSSIDDSLEKYANAIRKRIRETLRYGRCFDVSTMKIGKKHVILITVERTEKTNYYLNSNLELAFVRKGSTSRQMRSNEDREPDRRLSIISG